MRPFVLAGLFLATTTSPALGQSSGQGEVSVTIYNNNLALVQDVRQLDIPAGRSVQDFPGVSGQIRAETVSFTAPNTGIVEQNFDYDLLSPSKLMEKAVGETITIVRINPATGSESRERAKVLAANGGVVLQIGSRIEVLRDDRLPTRVIFDKVPDNLRARPTLSVTLNSSRAGNRPAQLSYLTSGLGWKADYVALFDEKAGKMDVQGWVTLTNTTGTTFDNAKTLLVAGTPNVNGRSNYASRNNIRGVGIESVDRESLGDFYLYPLAARTTIANAQTKQVSFLDVTGASAQKSYEYSNRWLGSQDEPQSVDTVLEFSSSSDGGLGDALPAGTVRVYMKDAAGQPQFIGENNIGHTPMGSELGLKTGEAFDVKVKATVAERRRLSSSKWRTSMSYELSNARPDAVTVSLIQNGLDFYWDDTRIVSESMTSKRRSSDSVVWKVPVPANGRTTVTAVFETRF
ncbi:DUF4139 domain-containing protein [Sphingorhabdus sp. SMR4y]|uniref:DUF4139 domain-containing protein n=1 Tax=Sphingorhabdus sp. SMR4y TaxID=2584094 RepID=UPI000B5CA9E6|nr:DUF4139 domain-containing protein [Sphingorhabdus sp. SMR4y]ASK88242.1 hypothetical protein SPHFLASMR4Y_01493 [Sphingorhabdus sp. SMR4y]